MDNQFSDVRKIGTINTIGLCTMAKREIDRFLSVYLQTIVAPAVTTLLFYAIFALAFGGLARDVGSVPFLHFLAPGLIMMAMVQNAFANVSSSLVISKVQGNIVDILMPPLSALEIYAGYIIGAVLRGLTVGVVAMLALSFFATVSIEHWWSVILFSVLGTWLLGSLGLAAGIWSDKFDHIAAVTNFVVTPLTFLSGTFYRVEMLPEVWRDVVFLNPFFYMIDGFRYGFIGQADGSLLAGVLLLLFFNLALAGLAYGMIRSGYKLKA
jgi:ABC-2 type transport system permease protein